MPNIVSILLNILSHASTMIGDVEGTVARIKADANIQARLGDALSGLEKVLAEIASAL